MYYEPYGYYEEVHAHQSAGCLTNILKYVLLSIFLLLIGGGLIVGLVVTSLVSTYLV